MTGQLMSPGNRPITSLRISVTDRCDLRCLFCMPDTGVPFMPAESHLTLAEIVRVVAVAARMGVSRVRLSGGEPLLRRDIVDLVREIARTPGIHEVSLVTNASRLERFALPLKAAGLTRLMAEFNSLDPHQFREITRGGSVARALAGLEAADQAGLPVQLRAVIMRGINDDQLHRLVDLAVTKGWQLRLIEYAGAGEALWDERFVPAAEMLARIQERVALHELPRGAHAPSKLYRIGDSSVTLGVITAINQHFCDACDRLRLTADGTLRSCLLGKGQADLLQRLRAGCTDAELAEVMLDVTNLKPEWHDIMTQGHVLSGSALR
jgi:cyclic pyranopterin phosphate synthase